MKKKKTSRIFLLAAAMCFITAIAFTVLLSLVATDEFISWYSRYNSTLESYELWIETYGATLITVVIILLNYFIKAYLPWFPVSCLCVASAVIFKWYIAAAINIVGMIIFFTAKFRKGRKHGGGKAERLLEKYRKPHDFIECGRTGSRTVLFLARLLPGVPLGAVSVFYGSTEISYGQYIIASVAGIAYKLFTYITIGRHVFDPASFSFIAPFIPQFVIMGFVMLSLSGVTYAAGCKSSMSRGLE